MEFEPFISDLDALSNRAQDAIKAGRYDEAEKLSQELLREYPEVFDGHWRLGQLRNAQGRFREAAECYSKVVEFIRQHPEGMGDETLRNFQEMRDQALAKAKG
jgi:tetratricopeptide (TPR) repeat protein